jgi:hypothetical protein
MPLTEQEERALGKTLRTIADQQNRPARRRGSIRPNRAPIRDISSSKLWHQRSTSTL